MDKVEIKGFYLWIWWLTVSELIYTFWKIDFRIEWSLNTSWYRFDPQKDSDFAPGPGAYEGTPLDALGSKRSYNVTIETRPSQ